jgi:flagellar hook-basal body complex protein FliE
MNIESIAAMTTETMGMAELARSPAPAAGPDFADYINQYYNDVNTQINEADVTLREFAVGEHGSIHDVMLAISKAKTSFELGLQVRNRLLEGYQELMRMQV